MWIEYLNYCTYFVKLFAVFCTVIARWWKMRWNRILCICGFLFRQKLLHYFEIILLSMVICLSNILQTYVFFKTVTAFTSINFKRYTFTFKIMFKFYQCYIVDDGRFAWYNWISYKCGVIIKILKHVKNEYQLVKLAFRGPYIFSS